MKNSLSQIITKTFLLMAVLLLPMSSLGQSPHGGQGGIETSQEGLQPQKDLNPGEAEYKFKSFAKKINSKAIEELPLQDSGRLKPFHTFAREKMLFVTGKYSLYGLNSIQLYLGLVVTDFGEYLEIINIRDPKIRLQLGFKKDQRRVSFQALSRTNILSIAQPLFRKQQQNSRSLSPEENQILEVSNQYFVLREILSGNQFLGSIEIKEKGSSGQHDPAKTMVLNEGQEFLRAVAAGDESKVNQQAQSLISSVHNQKMPELFRPQLSHMGLEVSYNKYRIFFIVAVLYLLIGIFMVIPAGRKWLTKKKLIVLLSLPLVLHIAGFIIRVVITGFAPVTNMYGTMIWVSFGTVIFSLILFLLYTNFTLVGSLIIGSSALLFITHSIPLILSPDMDPIVAVLRSNLWLTIHVLTIVISYAAFTIAMIIGNVALVRVLLGNATKKFLKEYAHHAYRIIQLGVFLLFVGIVLGGIWADYSWGRFWGWDPKETWSLIALLGYVAIQHARFVGWLKDFGVLAAATMAYLLVVMAWYGVNFILATGLHSYGFSSGGQMVVFTFTGVQVVLFALGVGKYHLDQKSSTQSQN